MFGRTLTLEYLYGKEEKYDFRPKPEPTNAEKKRNRFGSMVLLHALMNNAKIEHENKHTLLCSGYVKTKDRF